MAAPSPSQLGDALAALGPHLALAGWRAAVALSRIRRPLVCWNPRLERATNG